VIVVDPALLPEEVTAIKRFVDEVRGKRQLYLIFTHGDYDHIVGYGAFKPDKVFLSKAMAESTEKEARIERVLTFDNEFYQERNYPILYPEGTFFVYRDGVQYRYGNTKMTFYLAPGHTEDSMIVVVWQLGLCLAGDYLSDVEFPFIGQSSVAYVETLEKLPRIHDRNWFTRMVPGHGNPALTIYNWLQRRTDSLGYIYALRESIATGIPFDEESLWTKYKYPRALRVEHAKNLALMREEYAQGLWEWDPNFTIEQVEMPHEMDTATITFEADADE
jgi:hydroxyacylglutathione hydrolase